MQDKESAQNKVIALFEFIKELNKTKQKITTNVKDYNWHITFDSFPEDDEHIKIFSQDRLTEDSEISNTILTVTKPDFDKCPQPDSSIIDWLEKGWEKHTKQVTIKKVRSIKKSESKIKYRLETFIDDTDRVNAYAIWLEKRSEWIANYPNSKCPIPDASFADWLYEDWIYPHTEGSYKQFLRIREDTNECLKNDNEERLRLLEQFDDIDNDKYSYEFFEDDPSRQIKLDDWLKIRNNWVNKQLLIEKTRDFFTELYKINIDLEREPDTLELVAANGVLNDSDNIHINMPLLTRRVKINYDASLNRIIIENANNTTELNTQIFQEMGNINTVSIGYTLQELQKNDYHPFDNHNVPEFLKVLVHQLSPESKFSKCYNKDDISETRLYLYLKPMFVLRKRQDKTVKTIESIIKNIETSGFVPSPILDIVFPNIVNETIESHEETIDEQLAAVGGESIEILLSKNANKEQLEIAKRIEAYNAVIVQGPPGTGKTHTIANLMGHFLANGKTVLVTSHTNKALSVLKDKIDAGIRNLCVSILDDTNQDMEKSIDGITEMMTTDIVQLEHEKKSLAEERLEISKQLAEVRKKLFTIINQECNNIVLNGEGISPVQAVKFILENQNELPVLPGEVLLYKPLPLTVDELTTLYRSNESISSQDQNELNCDLPKPEEILSSKEFENLLLAIEESNKEITEIANQAELKITTNVEHNSITVTSFDFSPITITTPDYKTISDLLEIANRFALPEHWKRFATVDGRKGAGYKERWLKLINQIEETCLAAEKKMSQHFGKTVVYTKDINICDYEESFKELLSLYQKGGKPGFFKLLFKKEIKQAINSVKIDNKNISKVEDCELVLSDIDYRKKFQQCSAYWHDLIGKHTNQEFTDLDIDSPEDIAKKYIPEIKYYLDWYEIEYPKINTKLNALRIDRNNLFNKNQTDSDGEETKKVFNAIHKHIAPICKACIQLLNLSSYNNKLTESIIKLSTGKRAISYLCQTLINNIRNREPEAYAINYNYLSSTYAKYETSRIRELLLNKLALTAKGWADAIRTHDGIHGKSLVPERIFEAWKLKQLQGIISEITKQPYDKLQNQSLELSNQFKKKTAEYAEKSAWYYLKKRVEDHKDLQQALIGWKQTVQHTGVNKKNTNKFKAIALKLMKDCQKAVPAWIMPINKALENLDPSKNSFDYIIIDEASQADISSLAILYMGKKLIIVGDDKQVSPLAIGAEVEKTNVLVDMFIKDKIPNSHLYNEKTSIYDIASTTFHPLMLKEHFRCVPEIIGFSNNLSYDNKIKPLRDGSQNKLLPAVVNYRVDDGERIESSKQNKKEAEKIVTFIQACIEQPEYANKTFGVISLLGDEQAKLIQTLIFKYIDNKEIYKRRILCGNASNFQGDERDVIFLSLVDSNKGEGPLRMMGFGSDDIYRKRYNVAASRAKDQLWVVHSLDPANDLQSCDIRKRLIDYATDPHSVEVMLETIDSQSESEFEKSVATALTNMGYHLVQQWKVGAYRIDIVAIYGTQKVAIECDGEKYHSGIKIREDMERQTILERVGWRFIRIRGSEFYRNQSKTIDRVVSELNAQGVYPEESENDTFEEDSVSRTSELLERIKTRSEEIYQEWQEAQNPTQPVLNLSSPTTPNT